MSLMFPSSAGNMCLNPLKTMDKSSADRPGTWAGRMWVKREFPPCGTWLWERAARAFWFGQATVSHSPREKGRPLKGRDII